MRAVQNDSMRMVMVVAIVAVASLRYSPQDILLLLYILLIIVVIIIIIILCIALLLLSCLFARSLYPFAFLFVTPTNILQSAIVFGLSFSLYICRKHKTCHFYWSQTPLPPSPMLLFHFEFYNNTKLHLLNRITHSVYFYTHK